MLSERNFKECRLLKRQTEDVLILTRFFVLFFVILSATFTALRILPAWFNSPHLIGKSSRKTTGKNHFHIYDIDEAKYG